MVPSVQLQRLSWQEDLIKNQTSFTTLVYSKQNAYLQTIFKGLGIICRTQNTMSTDLHLIKLTQFEDNDSRKASLKILLTEGAVVFEK